MKRVMPRAGFPSAATLRRLPAKTARRRASSSAEAYRLPNRALNAAAGPAGRCAGAGGADEAADCSARCGAGRPWDLSAAAPRWAISAGRSRSCVRSNAVSSPAAPQEGVDPVALGRASAHGTVAGRSRRRARHQRDGVAEGRGGERRKAGGGPFAANAPASAAAPHA
eukprot:gene9840-biopygen12333